MAYFRFDGEGSVTAFGYEFDGGKAVKVTDEHAIRKLSGNGEFSEVAPLKSQSWLKIFTAEWWNK